MMSENDLSDDNDDFAATAFRPWQLIKQYQLKENQAVTLDPSEVSSFRARLVASFSSNAAAAGATMRSAEAAFESIYNCRLDQLTEGYIERRTEGVELVLCAKDIEERSTWLILAIGFKGGLAIDLKTEILPGEEGYSP